MCMSSKNWWRGLCLTLRLSPPFFAPTRSVSTQLYSKLETIPNVRCASIDEMLHVKSMLSLFLRFAVRRRLPSPFWHLSWPPSSDTENVPCVTTGALWRGSRARETCRPGPLECHARHPEAALCSAFSSSSMENSCKGYFPTWPRTHQAVGRQRCPGNWYSSLSLSLYLSTLSPRPQGSLLLSVS